MPAPATGEDSRNHLYFGTEVSVVTRFAYGGAIMAPLGGLDTPGLRLRAFAGGGRYRLDDGTWIDKQAGHVMAGWAHWRGDVGAAVYAGVDVEHHDAPATQTKHGTQAGFAAIADAWWRTGPDTLVSASAGYSHVYDNVHARVALSHDWNGRWGLVGEVRGGHDEDGGYWAAGAGIISRAWGIETQIIAGVSGDEDDTGFSLRTQIGVRR